MRNGIHAGSGCEHGGQTKGQFGIANGGLGNNEPRMESQFAAIVHNQNGATSNFTACAAGGRYGNEWRDAIGNFE